MRIDMTRADLHIRRQKGKTASAILQPGAGPAEQDGIRMEMKTRIAGGCLIEELSLVLPQRTLEENAFLEMERPVTVTIPLLEKPERITAMYMYGPWWTRPAFADSCADIPAGTQVAFFRFAETTACCIPMVGSSFKTMLHGGTDQSLCMEMTACCGGIAQMDEPVFLWAEAGTAQEAVQTAFLQLSREKQFPLRTSRRLPEMFRYLGWCSWDAFRTEVSADGIREKAAELQQKNVPIRWMLIDDGWLDSREKTLYGLLPDKGKFPGGFGPLTRELRDPDRIRWFGVWHALGGYWDGITPKSPLAAEKKEALLKNGAGRVVPDPRTGAEFYHDWYRELREEGIDFVKVDGQSACPFYYENSMPLPEAARGIHQALEGGASRMDGAMINCMGMAMENIVARPSSAVSRNSDDFLPDKEESFTEHLLQNAYNAVYHNEVYCCDWDMFWTTHVHAGKHALLRAISGGPVYVSDKPGMTEPAVLRPLALADGEILMLSRSAMPTEDCLFADPRKEGVLKLHNTDGAGRGGMAILNLTDDVQRFSFRPSDIPELLKGQAYWLYDYYNGTACCIDDAAGYTGTIDPGAAAWYILLPDSGRAGFLGLLDKYNSFLAAEVINDGEDTCSILLRESGRTGWVSIREPLQVTANGIDVTGLLDKKGELCTLALPEQTGKVLLQITWK